MGRKKDKGDPPVKKTPLEIRSEIHNYIRNERDTILIKWKALQEALNAEDRRRDEFRTQKLKDDTRILPENIQKFIGTLKRATRITMRDKGGTCYSVIRNMFLHWDADKSGQISSQELKGITNSLGVIMSDKERDEVVAYYGKGSHEMGYQELLRDIQKGEPTMIAFVDKLEEDKKNENEVRFEEVKDAFVKMPEIVKQFVEITQDWVDMKLRNLGGTPHYHIHHLFEFYDYDYSNGLSVNELIRAVGKGMDLQMSREQAAEIIRYYDRKGGKEMQLGPFLKDVTAGVKSILDFTEFTADIRGQRKKIVDESPFVRRPFYPAPNRVLEKFKRDVKKSIEIRVKEKGGSVKSWVKEAFINWDPEYTRKMSNPEHVIGAAKRLGVALSLEDAKVLMKSYDVWNTGEMHYMILAETLMSEDPHFLSDDKPPDHSTITARAPGGISKAVMKIKTAADAYAYKSKGGLQARDILHGTLLRFDKEKSGFLSQDQFQDALKELQVRLSAEETENVCNWFDSTGSRQLDINALTAQIFGVDVACKTLVLPKLGRSASGTVTMSSSSGLLSSSFNSINSTGLHTLNGTNISTMSLSKSMGKPSALTSIAHKEMMKSSAASAKNMEAIESLAVKVARQDAKKSKILLERAKIEEKLVSIEEQRKAVIDDYKIRHPKPKW